MGSKIGKGLVRRQQSNRDSSGYVKADMVFDIKKYGKEWAKFAAKAVHKVNIIPWQIKSKKDIAFLMKGDFHREIGEWVYSLNYWVHKAVHEERDILCPKKNFGKPCAICDAAEKKWQEYNDGGKTSDVIKKQANKLSARLRSMYNFEILAQGLSGKISPFEASDYIFEDELIAKATECEDGEEPVAFYETDTDEGRIVKFTRPEKAMDPSKNFEFRQRKNPISQKLLDEAMRFGELIKPMSSQEVKDFFYGAGYIDNDEGEEEEYEAPAEPEETYEEEETFEAEPEETYEAEEPAEEQETPAAESSGGKPDMCPSKKKFGLEYGEFDACDDCPAEMECHKAGKRAKG